jgi:peptidoglycan hydrolase-like protein with peptidoglycan-binding domain
MPQLVARSTDSDARHALSIAATPVSASVGADPPMIGVTIGDLVERWRRQISPEIPREILLAFFHFESGGRFDDATHGTSRNNWTVPSFYELGLFQTPAGLHGACRDRHASSCAIAPPGQEKPGETSPWARLCRRIGADPARWRNPETQVRVGLHDLEDGAATLRKEFPGLFPTPGSDWDLRLAVLYRFSRGGGYARSFLRPFQAQLAGMPEDQRWAFLRDRQVTIKTKKGTVTRKFAGENAEKKMALAVKLGYVPGLGGGAPPVVSTPSDTVVPQPPAPPPVAGTVRLPAELVRFAQRVLNAAETERLADDGDLGPLTRAALQRFRSKYGLGAGGILDEGTQLALAQRALEEIAQQSIFPRFGTRDPKTDQALRDFRLKRGLGFDSTVDAATRAALTAALRPAAPRPTAPAPAPSTSPTPTGISLGLDTASVAGNKDPAWTDARTRVPIEFAIIRSNYGVSEDRVFKRDWPRMRAAGVVRGAYLFLRFPHPKHGMKAPDPASQANAMIKAVGPLDQSDLPPTIDVEFPGGRRVTGLSAQRCLDDVRAAWRIVKAHYGVAPIIYTSGRVWHEHLSDLPAADLIESPLWLARYPYRKGPAVYDGARVRGLKSPPVPVPWGDAGNWWIHQYQGDAVRLPGFPTGNVDMNRFNVTASGATGDRVRWIQRRLGMAQSGVFDAATEAAVKAFQGRVGAPASGVVDVRTFARLCWANP